MSISNTKGPKDVAPFHLYSIFENPNGFEIQKLTSKCIQTNSNIIIKPLEKYFDPPEYECLIRRQIGRTSALRGIYFSFVYNDD